MLDAMRRIQRSDMTGMRALRRGGRGGRLSTRRFASSPDARPPCTHSRRARRATQRLDIVRGLLQLSIFASHATGTWIGVWLILAAWGLSDSSEQFVFLSGFTLGSVFARKAARDGWRAASADLLRRTWRLYRTHLLVFVLFGLGVAAAGRDAAARRGGADGLGAILTHPLAHLPGVLATLDQPEFMGILPLFVWCMLLLPGFAAAEARWGDVALALPLACYAAAWAVVAMPGLGWEDGIGFNPFAWQLLFLGGAWLGRRALLRGRALPFRRRLDALGARRRGGGTGRGAAGAAELVRVCSGPAPFGEVDWIEGKKNLAPAAAAARARAGLCWWRRWCRARRAWMHPRPAAGGGRIGQYSLEVFCLGLFLSWAASAVFRLLPAQGLAFAAQDVLLIGLGGVAAGPLCRAAGAPPTMRGRSATADGAQEKTSNFHDLAATGT